MEFNERNVKLSGRIFICKRCKCFIIKNDASVAKEDFPAMLNKPILLTMSLFRIIKNQIEVTDIQIKETHGDVEQWQNLINKVVKDNEMKKRLIDELKNRVFELSSKGVIKLITSTQPNIDIFGVPEDLAHVSNSCHMAHDVQDTRSDILKIYQDAATNTTVKGECEELKAILEDMQKKSIQKFKDTTAIIITSMATRFNEFCCKIQEEELTVKGSLNLKSNKKTIRIGSQRFVSNEENMEVKAEEVSQTYAQALQRGSDKNKPATNMNQKIFNNTCSTNEHNTSNIAIPKVKLTRIPTHLSDQQEIIEELRAHNKWLIDARIKINKTYEVNGKYEVYRNVIIETDLQTQVTLCKKGQLNFKEQTSKCCQYVELIQCFNCNQFGHKASHCRNVTTCRKCAR